MLKPRKKLIFQNTMHYKKVFNTKAFRVKIYKHLLINNDQNRILDSKLRKEDCSNEDIYNFLTMIRRRNNSIYQPITREEWTIIVKQSK